MLSEAVTETEFGENLGPGRPRLVVERLENQRSRTTSILVIQELMTRTEVVLERLLVHSPFKHLSWLLAGDSFIE